MPLIHQSYSIVHSAASAVLSAYTYNEIYTAIACTPIINGTLIPMNAGDRLPITVTSFSNTSGLFLLGEKANLANGGQSTGGGESVIGGSYAG